MKKLIISLIFTTFLMNNNAVFPTPSQQTTKTQKAIKSLKTLGRYGIILPIKTVGKTAYFSIKIAGKIVYFPLQKIGNICGESIELICYFAACAIITGGADYGLSKIYSQFHGYEFGTIFNFLMRLATNAPEKFKLLMLKLANPNVVEKIIDTIAYKACVLKCYFDN